MSPSSMRNSPKVPYTQCYYIGMGNRSFPAPCTPFSCNGLLMLLSSHNHAQGPMGSRWLRETMGTLPSSTSLQCTTTLLPQASNNPLFHKLQQPGANTCALSQHRASRCCSEQVGLLLGLRLAPRRLGLEGVTGHAEHLQPRIST